MSSRLTTLLCYFQPILLEFHMESVRWNQEGTPALLPWYPISTGFHQSTLYLLVNPAPYLVSRGWIPPKLLRASSYLQLQHSVNTHLPTLLLEGQVPCWWSISWFSIDCWFGRCYLIAYKEGTCKLH